MSTALLKISAITAAPVRCWIAAITLISFVTMGTAQESKIDDPALRKAVTFYASFDDSTKADFGGGDLNLSTRSNHETEKGRFVFSTGFDETIFRVAQNRGITGGALECTGVLPRNGRIFFPAKGNIAFRKGGWEGSVSFWINTDPNTMIKSSFCDPIQITQKGAGNGGIWVDFNDAKPRDLRHGAFPAVTEGQKPIPESDPQAPIVWVKNINFKAGNWHHVALTWKNFDTGRKDALSALYIDAKLMGEIRGQDIHMDWDIEKTGIYVAVGYIGLLDELALFNRALSAVEIEHLRAHPEMLAILKKSPPTN